MDVLKWETSRCSMQDAILACYDMSDGVDQILDFKDLPEVGMYELAK